MLHRRLFVLALSSLLALIIATPARADSGVTGGVRLGYYANADAPFAGAELLFKVAPSVYFNPNVEAVFQDDSYFTVNADVHYDFPRHGRALFWAGAGLGIVAINPPGPADGKTDAALNLLLGVGLARHPLEPYFQAKLIAKDDSELSLALGLRF